MKFEPIPNYGSHMTLKSFIGCCKSGGFIDYDGFGYYATKDKVSDKIIRPSHITGKFKTVEVKEKLDLRFKYIVWFNK